MNLVLDGRYIQDHYPGVGRYAYQLALHLIPAEEQERLLLLHDPSAVNTRFDLGPLCGHPHVHLIGASCSPLGLRQHLVVPGLLRRQRADVYLAPHWGSPRWLCMPVVTTVHDLTPWVLGQEAGAALPRWVYQRLLRQAVQMAAGVVVSSMATRHDLERLIPKLPPVTVAPLGVDRLFRPRDERDWKESTERLGVRTPFVLYVGTNRPHKNLGRLLQAWAILSPALRKDWQLVLAGAVDGRWEDPTIEARRLGVEAAVRRLGRIAEGELAHLYAAAEVCVIPSLYEGFGLPAVEAMASGAAVAASQNAALPEVVGEAGLLFDPTSIESMADALARLIEDGALRERLQARGQQRAALYTWSRTAAMVRHALRQALGTAG